MKKSEQLKYIDRFLDGKMEKRELRKLVRQLLHDERLLRNFRVHASMKGIFL